MNKFQPRSCAFINELIDEGVEAIINQLLAFLRCYAYLNLKVQPLHRNKQDIISVAN